VPADTTRTSSLSSSWRPSLSISSGPPGVNSGLHCRGGGIACRCSTSLSQLSFALCSSSPRGNNSSSPASRQSSSPPPTGRRHNPYLAWERCIIRRHHHHPASMMPSLRLCTPWARRVLVMRPPRQTVLRGISSYIACTLC
jgi:hypothetical protein